MISPGIILLIDSITITTMLIIITIIINEHIIITKG